MELDAGKILVLLIAVAIKAVLVVTPVAAVLWFVTRTSAGRRFIGRETPAAGTDLARVMADELRGLQSQLDDAHSRLDFVERVMVEQCEQLRALGAPEPLTELREPTPV